MKRFIASIGLVLIAAHIALGGTGALFLCLCVGHEDAPTPCAPAAIEQADSACLHDQSDSRLDSAEEQESCEDLLLVGSDLFKPLERQLEVLKLKAGLFKSEYPVPSLDREPIQPERIQAKLLAHSLSVPDSRTRHALTTRLLL